MLQVNILHGGNFGKVFINLDNVMHLIMSIQITKFLPIPK